MAGLMKEALGNDGMAEMVGKVVGDKVEDVVKDVLSGDDKGKKTKEKEKGGGFDPGNVLSMVGGMNEGGEGAGGVKDLIGGFLK